MYGCKVCGRPVEQSIEGEIICVGCWTLAQMSPEDIALDAIIAAYEREKATERKPDDVCCVCSGPIFYGVYHTCFMGGQDTDTGEEESYEHFLRSLGRP